MFEMRLPVQNTPTASSRPACGLVTRVGRLRRLPLRAAAARSRARGCPLAMSDAVAGFIGGG